MIHGLRHPIFQFILNWSSCNIRSFLLSIYSLVSCHTIRGTFWEILMSRFWRFSLNSHCLLKVILPCDLTPKLLVYPESVVLLLFPERCQVGFILSFTNDPNPILIFEHCMGISGGGFNILKWLIDVDRMVCRAKCG